MGNTGKLTLLATGDVLLHRRLYRKAKKLFGFDFVPKLEAAKPIFEQADLRIVNQESIIAGDKIGLSTYPRFNSPAEIGNALKFLGVDIVNIANNHVMDRGEEGILLSIENLEKLGLPYVGAYKSPEDQEELRIIIKNGLRVCFLSYTRSTNSILPPKGKEYLVNKFLPNKLKSIKELIKKIRNQDMADVIVVSLHYGKEYHLFPTSEQQEVARDLSDAGADVILGHHPHVLQPPEWILNSRGKKTLVAYSLGNFYTGQEGLYRQIGGILSIDISKPNPNNTMLELTNPKMKLTFVDSTDKRDFKLSIFEDVVKKEERIKTDMGEFQPSDVYEELKNRMTMHIPELDIS